MAPTNGQPKKPNGRPKKPGQVSKKTLDRRRERTNEAMKAATATPLPRPSTTDAEKEVAKTKQRLQRSKKNSRKADREATELAQHHSRRPQLSEIYEGAIPGSHLAGLAEVALHMLKGSTATCLLGSKDKIYSLVTTVNQLQQTLEEPPQIILYRNHADFETTSAITLERLLKDLETAPNVQIDIQDAGEPEFNAVRSVPTSEYLTRMRGSGGKVTASPVNALNLSTNRSGILPRQLDSKFRLMHEATAAWVKERESEAQHGKTPNHQLTTYPKRGKSGPGSTTTYALPADIQSCRQFLIIGQAGAVSGCHLDNMAPFTAVILHKNDAQNSEVLKYWCIVDVQNLGEDERREALKDSAKHGSQWRPEPSWIKIIPLVAGDCLIMPPGTIHAPITVTDCLFTGGMYWCQRYFVSHTLPHWFYIAQNRDTVTNEDPAFQTKDILEWLKSQIQKEPREWNLKEENLAEVIKMCDSIQALSSPCTCTKRTHIEDCQCRAAGFNCFKYCKCYHTIQEAK